MPRLVLGPLLRHVTETTATVWVQTDQPGEVTVSAGPVTTTTHTFCVARHSFALAVLDGLAPGSVSPYQVQLDGQPVWPLPHDPWPAPVVRTLEPGRPLRLLFGSCRVVDAGRPTRWERWSRRATDHGIDALATKAEQLRGADPRDPDSGWPDLLLHLGDQVYADQPSPQTLAFARSRRDITKPPGTDVADIEEYFQLYRESWSEPAVRWLLSTVPSAMVFDDHDISDDWNTSAAWVEKVRASSWWDSRIRGGLAAYWIYQHLGNLSPAELESDEVLALVRRESDAWPALSEMAHAADRGTTGTGGLRWSYARDLGPARLVVVDSRCGRVLAPHRSMVDDAEWRWLGDQVVGGPDHLLLATSLPWLLPPAISWLEMWDEAVAGGAWGPRWAGWGEKVRQRVDLEHWAAFRTSFDALSGLVADLAAGVRGPAPASVVAMSGDVHNAYLARARWPGRSDVTTPVWQAVCSPMHNPVDPGIRVANRLASRPALTAAVRGLARLAGVTDPDVEWGLTTGPWFGNEVATLVLEGRTARMELERADRGRDGVARLDRVWAGPLT